MQFRRAGVRVSPGLLILLLPWATARAEGPPDRAVVDGILAETLKTWHAPGIAVAIVRDDQAYFFTRGVRELQGDALVTPDTVFGIGSCTKAFTATALAILVEESKASWDDPVRKHLPWFRLADPLADKDVRLRDLLCHRTGLARHELLWYRAPWSIEESVRRLAFVERSSSFRSKYEYNNLAYLAAGLAISSAAKKPWHEFVRERLFVPLRMKSAVFTSGEAQKAADHATPHSHNADSAVIVIPWYNDDRQIRASGSIKTSVRDLSQWVRFHLGGRPYEGKSPVSAAGLAETHAPQMVVPLTEADRAAGATQASYGLGWHITDYRGHALHEHGGAVDGFRARIVLVPRKKLGLVLLTNLDDMGIVNAAGNHLLDHLLGLEKKDWHAFFTAQHKRAEAARKDSLRKRQTGRVPGTKPSLEREAYTGTYTEPAYGTVTITQQDDMLMLSWSSFRLPLTHFHYDTFQTPKDGHVPDALRAESAVFELNEDAEVSTLRFLGRIFTRDEPRKKSQE